METMRNSGRNDGVVRYRKTMYERKHASILSAAVAEITLCGFQRAAMFNIAADADVSTATLYKHFGGKEDLYFACAEHISAHRGELAANIFVAKAMIGPATADRQYGPKSVKRGMATIDGFISAMQDALQSQTDEVAA